ncbi:MAG: hypothetical protein LRY67_01365 [Gammaproteobacteria bacterium]|nr:hypothetical protein [Gammaproteobacteria bacterium]MCD8543124.1 hypothetical protein [Gammaproteobacteria bacterium]MCD8573707.1 hypothetical protein [Gammaproteobacteria bacterium]
MSGGCDTRICLWQAMTGVLLWCTRSSQVPLFAFGLRLTHSVGLTPNQYALLASAGCDEI